MYPILFEPLEKTVSMEQMPTVSHPHHVVVPHWTQAYHTVSIDRLFLLVFLRRVNSHQLVRRTLFLHEYVLAEHWREVSLYLLGSQDVLATFDG